MNSETKQIIKNTLMDLILVVLAIGLVVSLMMLVYVAVIKYI
jgi:hypothetical protein